MALSPRFNEMRSNLSTITIFYINIFTAFATWASPLAWGQGSPPAGEFTPPYQPKIEPASDEGREAMRRFRVPQGLEIGLFAAEPMLANPVAISIDGRNRVYVAETFRRDSCVPDIRDHMDWLDDDLACRTVDDRLRMYRKYLGDSIETLGIDHERVRLVEDRDGDGRADRATVFADGFNSIATGIGSGVLARGSDVWYTCSPDLWHLIDTDGDGRADRRDSLMHGFGVHNAVHGHDLHGLRFGPDGKLYFSIGDRGFNVETGGRNVAVLDSGSVVRCNPDGSDFEVFAVGLRNPQELAFDKFGNLFTVDNNSDHGDKSRVVHIVEGGDSGWRVGYQFIDSPVKRSPWFTEKLWHTRFEGQAAYTIPPLMHLSDGPAGFAFEPGTALNDSYRDRFFLADFRGGSAQSGVRSFALRPSGASFEVEDSRQFLWSILATDVEFGTDGALYVSDWVDGWNKTGKGRIYRVSDPSMAKNSEAHRVASVLAGGLGGLPPKELADLLAHPDLRVRQEAQFVLARNGRDAIPIFAEVVRPTHPLLARIHALWGLGQVGREDPSAFGAFRVLLDDAEAEVRAQAAKLLGDGRRAEFLDRLLSMLKDDNPRVRMFTALALGKLGRGEAVRPLLDLLRENADRDPYLRHAGVMGLAGVGDLEALRVAGADHSASVRMGVLLALRRMGRPEVGQFLNDPEPLLVLEAARAINDAPIEAAMPALARLADRPGMVYHLMRRVLNANLRLGGPENAKAVARLATRGDVPIPVRVEALEALAGWAEPPGRDRMVGLWRPLPVRSPGPAAASLRPVLDGLLRSAPAGVRAAAASAAGRLAIREAGPFLRAMLSDDSSPAEATLRALRSLDQLDDPGLVDAVRRALGARDVSLRIEALRLLARIDPAAAIPVIEKIMKGDLVADIQGALEILGCMGSDPAADTLLSRALDLLIAGLVPPEVQLDYLEAARRRSSPEIQSKLRRYEAQRPADDGLASYREMLVGGAARRGRKIFAQKAEVSCLRCHKVEGGGGEVGPNLNGIGKTRDRRYILESIVAPNARIADGFETRLLATSDGKVYSGILKEDTPDRIRLMTSEGAIRIILKDDIEEQNRGRTAMPEDLAKSLTSFELRDLVEYLAGVDEAYSDDDRSDSGGKQ